MGTYALRGLWLACVLLFSVMVGTGVGVLTFVGGDNIAHALLASGAAFAGTAAFALLIIGFLTATGADNQS
jgi:hypothetical protein